MLKTSIGMLLTLGALLSSAPSFAETAYPTQTIRIVVPFTPGGGTDLTARIVADQLSKSLGQSVVVENRPGAASQLGISYVAKARPDGYTLLWTSADGISVLPAVKVNLPYKIPDSLAFVTSFASFPLILGVSSKLPINTMQEFIAYAKAHPGQLHYSSSGTGGGGHLQPAYMAKVLGLDMVHVPFESAAPAVVAVAGGHAEFTNVAPSTVGPYLTAGTVRAIATTGRNRTSMLPDLPTMTELGYPQLTEDFFYGMYAPAGTPPDIIKKLQEAVQAVLRAPGTTEKLHSLGLEPLDLSSDEFKDFVIKDLNRWTEIAKAIDFHLD
ncbi:Bug family tripartite tricarboxylate transporter substrate binding protein [Chelatococcus sp. GCM10030263]|uniref:Bug family tripartite tricarboxylate transporter substrate binding protein n=1 Tax=Chelatococcus sp. GCM10030263 TaxID=3273387 RepID=UPI0036209FCD